MDADTMAARHRAAVQRYARQVADDGYIPDAMLRELADIAGEHAEDVAEGAAEAAGATESHGERAGVESPAPAPVRPAGTRTAARRRTGTRTR